MFPRMPTPHGGRTTGSRMLAARTEERPVSPNLLIDAIPEELKALARWVGWMYQLRDAKWAKTPVSCHTGRAASVTDPASWGTFEEAYGFFRRRGGKIAGIGFVFAQEDPYT